MITVQRCATFSSVAMLAITALLTPFTAWGGAMVDVDLPTCQPASHLMVIDGKFDDWQGIEGKRFQPVHAFDGTTMAEDRPDLGATVRFTFDAEALYASVEWQSPKSPANRTSPTEATDWQLGGDGVEWHLLIGGMVTHIASYPSADGKRAVLLARREGETTWKDITTEHGAVALATTPKGYIQETRIPWRILVRNGTPPTDKPLPVMIDLAWRELPSPTLAKLSEDIRRNTTHFTYNVLTSRNRLFSRNYLSSSADWGELVFVDTVVGPRLEDTTLGSGMTMLAIGRAVLAPTVDGVLMNGEWPAGAQCVQSFAPDFIGRRYGLLLAALSDDANLYLAARFSVPGKPINLQPENQQQGFRGGDCLQIRLSRGGRVVNLCAWYDSANGKPALTADGKDLANPLLLAHGAKAAVGFGDGEYTMEMAIPWQELFPGSAPRAGEKMRATFQPWWSGVDPRFTLSGALKLEGRSPLAFAYTMPRDAEVTIGVFNKNGGLLRWLTRSEFRRAGKNTEYWDGHDQDGKPLPAGGYIIKALYHDPLGLEYQLSVGNPGTPPWSTADGKGDWIGDESNVQSAVSDGDWVWLASPSSEKGFSIIGVDGAGQRRWGVGNELSPRTVSLAVQGDYLYAAYCGPEKTDTQYRFTGANAENRVVLRCFDKRTGVPARFTRTKPSLRVATWPYAEKLFGLWELFTTHSFDPDTYGGLPRYGDCQYGEAVEVLGIAATADTVWIAYHTQGCIRAYDALTGNAQPALDINIEKPVGLFAQENHTLLAVSGKRVVKVDLATKIITPVVTTGLSAPYGVMADRAGIIYVSDWRDAFQVKVFAPTGKFLRAIGTPGGRAVLGKWDRNGMLLPRGIAVTHAGKLWVAEDDTTPRRVSVWNAATGAFQRDYIGPTPYGGGSPFWFEPGDQTIVHTMGTRFSLDWKNKTWTPLASELRRQSHEQPFALCGASGMCHTVRTFKHDKHDYAVIPTGYDLVTIQQRKGDYWQPVAAVGTLHRWQTDDGSGATIWDSDVGAHMVKGFRPDCFRGHIGDNFAWSDRNGDGLVQPEEMTWKKTVFRGETYVKDAQPEFLLGWGFISDQNLNIYLGGECKVAGGDDRVLFRIAPTGWTNTGVPLFDINTAVEFTTTHGTNGIYADTKGNIFAAGAEDTSEDALTCYNRNGTKLWRIAGKEKPRPTDVVLSNVSGEFDLPGIGPAIGTWAWHGNFRPYLISTDGLYIGTLLEDTKLGPSALWDESWRFWYQAPDGTPYLINGANDAQHVLKITGLEHAGRFAGLLTISAADAARAAAARPDDGRTASMQTPPLNVLWRDTPPVIDGDIDDWDLDSGVTIPLGKERAATAVLARDADTLYMVWKVDDDSPLKNLGGNWQTLFLTGDCVDLLLATDPKSAPTRSTAAAGDLRLLLSVFQDKPVAVLYRPVLPGTVKPVQLMAARIDRIDLLNTAKLAVKRTTDSYSIEAAIPLAALGLSPTGLDTLRGDLGVISSDLAGRDRIKRTYHFNRNTDMTADLTTEATLQPAEWGTIRFPLGKNLLRDGGFENGLAAKIDDGWAVTEIYGGMKVTTSPDGAHTGRRGLLFRQILPVVYPAESFNAPDYSDFLKAGNAGKGGGNAVVAQRVPVTGGKHYSLRLFRRCEGMKGNEIKTPGKDRGYTALHTSIDFLGSQNEHKGVETVYEDTDWTLILNTGDHMLPRPYLAPIGATSAIIAIRAVVNAPECQPVMAVDDVEFVEVAE